MIRSESTTKRSSKPALDCVCSYCQVDDSLFYISFVNIRFAFGFIKNFNLHLRFYSHSERYWH